MGVACREYEVCVGFGRDGVLGLGVELFLSGGLGILAVWKDGIVILCWSE
jgi:hypothetical protein